MLSSIAQNFIPLPQGLTDQTMLVVCTLFAKMREIQSDLA